MDLKEKIAALVEPVLQSEGFELVEIKLAQYKRSSRLMLFVDSDQGVSIDDCVRLTKAVEPILEESNLFSFGYIIEISSPGLDRPLKTPRDFKRRLGKRVRLFLLEDESRPIEGELMVADDRHIELMMTDDKAIIEINKIKFGKIII